MIHLTRNDYASALRLLAGLEAECGDIGTFSRACVAAVSSFVASEAATFSVCDVAGRDRQQVGKPGHDRRIRLDCVVAVPLFTDGRTLASIELHRRGLGFSERDRERLELLRPHLAFLYRQACQASCASAPTSQPIGMAQPEPIPVLLTPREGEVMYWLSCGKTDTEIAALLAISPRTVHKHLEHIYVKLGVETRTAAVMRARELAAAAGREPGPISGYRPGRGISAPGIPPCRGAILPAPGPTA